MADSQILEANTSCPECDEFGPFTRNHFFTGKLLVERDFTDEQRYFIDKLRHHHHRLHGSGVACGLKVSQHPDPACRDRYLCIEPGSAIDCCGREIIIPARDLLGRSASSADPVCGELVDLHEFEDFVALEDDYDANDHALQICICYRECGTEEIPVLYDECGCDDTRCAPNRVLESYEIKIKVDPAPMAVDPSTPTLDWKSTVGIVGASAAVLDESKQRLFVMTDGDESSVYEVSTDNLAIKSCRSLATRGIALILSPDGASLYVVTVAPGSASDARQLLVLDPSNLDDATAPVPMAIPDSSGYGIDVGVSDASPERLYVLIRDPGTLQIWERSDPTSIARVATITDPDGNSLRALAVSSDGTDLYSIQPGASCRLRTFDVTDAANPSLDPTPLTPELAGAEPVALTMAKSTGADLLVAATTGDAHLHLVDPAADAIKGSVALDEDPIDVVVGPGGQWAYLLGQATGGDTGVRGLDLHRLQLGQEIWSESIKVGTNSRSIVITESGARLFVPYVGDPNNDCDGGVAIVGVMEADCEAICWRSLDGCPTCEDPCVVLATIENYRAGYALHDQTDPPSAVEEDVEGGIARIDNRLGREMLLSTQTLADLIKCVMTRGQGMEGKQGPQGPPGQGITDVEVEHHDCVDGQPPELPDPAATLDANGVLTLHVANGCDGEDGANGADGQDGAPGEGLESGLTRINALSWKHDEVDPDAFVNVTKPGQSAYKGLVIGFSSTDIQLLKNDNVIFNHVFQVLVPPRSPTSVLKLEGDQTTESRFETLCWCPLLGAVEPVRVITSATDPTYIESAVLTDVAPNGLAFIPETEPPPTREFLNERTAEELAAIISPHFLVTLDCDFVVDGDGRAVDGEFARRELPTGDRPAGSDHGNQGGRFTSWFALTPNVDLHPRIPDA